jgi:hypothetical protein
LRTSHKYILLLTILSLLCLLAIGLYAQDKAKYQPTEIQLLKLQNKQKDAVIAKQALDALQAQITNQQKAFQEALKSLNDEAEAIKKENSWPKELTFDPNNVVFTEPAKDKK